MVDDLVGGRGDGGDRDERGTAILRYAAVGDSFTEGVGDEVGDGATRGWADRVAAGLAATADEPVSYANFAVRGRLLDTIVTGQLEQALALDPPPTLVTLNGGGNDLLRPRADVARIVALTSRAVRRCVDAGARVVLISGADPSAGIPLGATVHRRGDELTRGIADLAGEGVRFVDVFHDAEIRRPGYWSPDRLHLNAAGHRRVAALVLAALGRPAGPGGSVFDAPARSWGAELRFYREHVLPWVGRRLRGRSSGDARVGKHLDWTTVVPAAETG